MKLVFRLLAFVALAAIGYGVARATIRADSLFLEERLRDAISSFGEKYLPYGDDSPARLDRVYFDYQWLESEPYIFVAHRSGFTSQGLENSLAGINKSYLAGFKYFEIDIWLNEHGRFACVHDFEPKTGIYDCDFRGFLNIARSLNSFLILDIKSDFETGLEQIDDLMVNSPELRKHVIFQVYSAQDISTFTARGMHLRFPGPVLTAYRSYKGVNSLAAFAKSNGVRALAIPAHRAAAIRREYGKSIVLFAHPVSSCDELNELVALGFRGVYGVYGIIRCPRRPG